MSKPKSLRERCADLNKRCIAYQEHLLKEIKNADIPQGVSIHYGYTGNPSVAKNHHLNPTKVTVHGKTEAAIPFMLIAEKYNKTQQLRETLYGEGSFKTRLLSFGKLFYEPETEKIIAAHRDNIAVQFFKNVAFVLSSFFLGAGLIGSYYMKNSISFWKSHGEVALEDLEYTMFQSHY